MGTLVRGGDGRKAYDRACVLLGEDCQEPRHPVWVLHAWDGDVHVYVA